MHGSCNPCSHRSNDRSFTTCSHDSLARMFFTDKCFARMSNKAFKSTALEQAWRGTAWHGRPDRAPQEATRRWGFDRLLKQKLSPQSRPLNFRSADVRHEVRPQASSSPSANRLLPSSQANSRPRLHHHHHLPRQQQRPRPAPSGGLRCRHRPEMSSR